MLQGPIGLPRPTRRRPVSPWTKQRTRVLRRRWAQGARVWEIAAELGHGITYNAVIGKIHRLGIADQSPYGGAPGRRYTANTRPADRSVHAPRRLVVPERTAAGLGRRCQGLCRDRWRRRAHPAPPAPFALRIER